MLNYAVHAENKSLYNTPPAFAVYALGLVMKWLIGQGGLAAIAKINERKAFKLWAETADKNFHGVVSDHYDLLAQIDHYRRTGIWKDDAKCQ